ncbi:MAG: transketolase C-terminal domain-containing protein, partial [Lawsonibacter sp.]
VTIISSGIMLVQCLAAADALREGGVSARVLNMHTIKPIDQEAVIRAAQETGRIVTVENHSIIGGLGSAVAEILAESCPVPMKRVGIRDRFGEVGNRAYLRQCLGIDTPDIVEAAMELKRAHGT